MKLPGSPLPSFFVLADCPSELPMPGKSRGTDIQQFAASSKAEAAMAPSPPGARGDRPPGRWQPCAPDQEPE
jgi:hypothetical protein